MGMEDNWSLRPGLPLVFYHLRCFDLVSVERNGSDFLLQTDADRLLPIGGGACISDGVVLEHQIPGLTTHTNTRHLTLDAVVLDDIVLKAVTMACHALG